MVGFTGIILSSFGYMGKIARYVKQEEAPVAKDAFNYLADGTKGGIETVAGAIGKGLRKGTHAGHPHEAVHCHKCHAPVSANAKFCSQCGHSLGKTKACANCHELNDPDAKFCGNCGQAIA